jgi:hypothetical protein
MVIRHSRGIHSRRELSHVEEESAKLVPIEGSTW